MRRVGVGIVVVVAILAFAPAAAAQLQHPIAIRFDQVTDRADDDACGGQELYARVSVDGRPKRRTPLLRFSRRDSKAPDDWLLGETFEDPRPAVVHIEMWEDDDALCGGGDDQIDIAGRGKFSIDLEVSASCTVRGDVRGRCGELLTSRGNASASAQVRFRVSRGCSDEAGVLVCAGPEFYDANGNYDQRRVRDMIMPPPSSGLPTLRGKLNFIARYGLDPTGRALDEGDGGSPSVFARYAPRPLIGLPTAGTRGLTRGRVNAQTMAGHLGVQAQEFGHAWLVPNGVTVSGRPVATVPDIERAINAGRPVPDLPLLGRADSHWSSFVDAEGSPMDGVNWEPVGTEGSLDVWEPRRVDVFAQTGIGTVNVGQRFSDLDLWAMGIHPRPAPISYMIPKVTTPTNFHAGLVVVFDEDDIVYFGFRDHFRAIAVQRAGQRQASVAQLDTSYQPYAGTADEAMLRVLKRGAAYCFQVRARIGTTRVNAESMMQGASNPCPAPSATASTAAWTTVAMLRESAPPRAIGFSTKTYDPENPYVFAKFQNLYIGTGLRRRTIVPPRRFQVLPTRNYLSGRFPDPERALALHRPLCRLFVRNGCPRVDVAGDRVRFITPVTLNTDHWSDVDKAPKVLTRAPAGDFGFATSARLESVLIPSYAAGDVYNQPTRQMIGDARTADASAFGPRRLKGEPPPDNTYRAAFTVIARNRRHVSSTLLDNVRLVRDAFVRYYEAITTLTCDGCEGAFRRIDTNFGPHLRPG